MSAVNPRPRAGNRRDEAARLAVLHAADDLLVEHGFAGLTVEAIARRAGVAKQTIYRWWPSKVEILLDTLIADSEKRVPVPTAPATADVVLGYFRDFARFVVDDPAGRVLLTLVAQAQHDTSAAESFRTRYLAPRRERERDLLARAVDAGAISPRLDLDATLDALIGPVVYRALTGAGGSDDLVTALGEDLLGKP
ncbi:TetR/AcrR family transcriptional regulator [Saccharothrix violaceirubra]|uniref:AcrR family transcriptional regulator n=1 Tax=Saccharothrix violaceirubra TaxID=413306 RepID=A0A7W7WUY2_9PSEU|nr:TetR/AcrR family transcriptional regulator [Saccharothrix violaceirubra]MBB4964745.1 AcrR family transcriptional regulator [Saccharothrix violaceirubra]